MVNPHHSSTWAVVTASALGSSHRVKQSLNQDAVATFEINDGLCIAIADGHGGSRYVRSAEGSRLAAETARRLGSEALRRPERLIDVAPHLPARLVSDWRADVSAHLTAAPFDAEIVQLVGADPFVAYGTTLMLVLLRGDEAIALQLGDGDVVVAWTDGSALRPVPEDGRNVAGQTTSMCLSDAVESFRIASLVVDQRIPELVLVSTDGYGNSFADPRWPTRVSNDLLRLHHRLGTAAIAEALPNWAAESAEVGGDDTTVAVAFRDPRLFTSTSIGTPPPLVTAPPAGPRPLDGGITTSLGPRAGAASSPAPLAPPASRRSLALLSTATATLCIGAIAGFVFGRGGDADVTSTTTGATTSATADSGTTDTTVTTSTATIADPGTSAPHTTVADTTVADTTSSVPFVTNVPPVTNSGPPTTTEAPPPVPTVLSVVAGTYRLVSVITMTETGPECRLESAESVPGLAEQLPTQSAVPTAQGVWALRDDVVTFLPWGAATASPTEEIPAVGARVMAALGSFLVVPNVTDPAPESFDAEVYLRDITTGAFTTSCGLVSEIERQQ
jgi:hypothetical protein